MAIPGRKSWTAKHSLPIGVMGAAISTQSNPLLQPWLRWACLCVIECDVADLMSKRKIIEGCVG